MAVYKTSELRYTKRGMTPRTVLWEQFVKEIRAVVGDEWLGQHLLDQNSSKVREVRPENRSLTSSSYT